MTGMTALLGYTAWTLVLVGIVLTWRVFEVLRGKRINSWGRGASIAVPSFIERAGHAHLNVLENLPVFAVIVLAAQLLGKTAGVDALGCWVLGARVAQSVVHLIGTSVALVMVRATFYVIQIALFAYLLWGLAT
ncbi:MAPEG family protein [Solimonas variicoloris]|uniref:MAPEG family protein n=1 Tax=Solimonas variicoloris TaxID=254408 RepID=UPI000475EC5A|nr:MAPEG family protein [Solimonas variicoloris]